MYIFMIPSFIHLYKYSKLSSLEVFKFNEKLFWHGINDTWTKPFKYFICWKFKENTMKIPPPVTIYNSIRFTWLNCFITSIWQFWKIIKYLIFLDIFFKHPLYIPLYVFLELYFFSKYEKVFSLMDTHKSDFRSPILNS